MRIAEHAKWLIEEQKLNRKNKWIDVDVWTVWLRRAEALRREAKETGRTQGARGGDTVNLEDDMDLEDIPLPPDPARRTKNFATVAVVLFYCWAQAC